MRLELSTIRSSGPANASPSLMNQWRIGAVVEAIAVRDASDGQLWLSIGATRVPARIASGDVAGPENGERLRLRVLRDSPVLALETIVEEDTEAQSVGDALRRFVPRQTSPAPLLANLSWLASHPDEHQQLSRHIGTAAQRLWQALPDTQELSTADGVANAVKRSGGFLEASLARTDAGYNGQPVDARQIVARDIKALLITLKQALSRGGANPNGTVRAVTPGPLPSLTGDLTPLSIAPATLAGADTISQQLSELSWQTDGALARLNTTQLMNSEASHSASAWLVEVPFRQDGRADTLRFRFERHGKREQTEQAWTIEAALNLGKAGMLHAKISLHGKRIGVQLRGEPAQLVSELNAQAPLLTSMLTDAGLDVDRVVCLHGLPNEPRELRTTTLLDIRV